jgi:hypothetical protein
MEEGAFEMEALGKGGSLYCINDWSGRNHGQAGALCGRLEQTTVRGVPHWGLKSRLEVLNGRDGGT